jgi:ATP-dependent DNA helicase RecG
MNRLLQGDVGAGKTIVTLFAIFLAIENGYQTALIAPTEILAEQHFHTISKLTENIDGINICLIKGGTSKQKTTDKKRIAAGEINIAIGTHALFQKDVVFKNLSLVVIDEQHRFGVSQRSELSVRHNYPDLLYLSATPIPRSLAMTVFGEMTVSSIDELPPTRKPVKTILVPSNQKQNAYQQMQEELYKGRQIYIVCPLIEESEKVDLQDAESLFESIRTKIFPHVKSALLHGQMKAKDKEEIMQDFAQGNIKILISTTVIEVGIDVPNASVMMIEHAERFGLAQLHQLRGRVGRGAEQSFCYLVAYAMSEIGRERLNTMVRTNDGFVIAEKDLELRGPGDMFGTAQSGLPDFKFANIITDQNWLNLAKNDAFALIEDDPELSGEEHRLIRNYYESYVVKRETYSKF